MSVNGRAAAGSHPAARVVYVRIFFGLTLTLGFGSVLFLDFITGSNLASSAAALLVAGLGLHEFYRMQENRQAKPFRRLGIACGVALLATHWARWAVREAGRTPAADPVLSAAAAAFIFVAAAALVRHREKGALDGLFATFAGIFYIWLPLGFMLEMRNFPGLGTEAAILAVLHMLATAKMGDVGAFFTGRLLGRRKLAPVLSPGKTIEGSAGGLVSSIATSLVLCLAFPQLGGIYGIPGALIFGFAVGVVAQVGDLFESMIKRASSVKNSGELIPEFGGLLDVIDSVLFSAPVAYFLLASFA